MSFFKKKKILEDGGLPDDREPILQDGEYTEDNDWHEDQPYAGGNPTEEYAGEAGHHDFEDHENQYNEEVAPFEGEGDQEWDDTGARHPRDEDSEISEGDVRPGLGERLKAFLARKKTSGAVTDDEDDQGHEERRKKPKRSLPRINFGKSGSKGMPRDITVEDRVVRFGGKPTAAALFWDQSEDDTPIRERAAQLDEKAGVDSPGMSYRFWVDLKKSGQIGLTREVNGHRAGMPALISLVSTEMAGENWLGAFQLDDRNDIWWLGSIRDGEVFEDQILTSRMQAEDLFMRSIDAPGLEVIFAPEEWGISGTRADHLADLLDPRQGVKIRHIRPFRAHMPKIIGAALVMGVIAGGAMWYQNKKEAELRALEEMQRRIRENVAVTPQDLPWFQVTAIRDFIDACETEIGKTSLIVPGWASQPVSCTITQGEGVVISSWRRDGGTPAWLRSGIAPDLPQPEFIDNGVLASQTVNFTAPVREDSFEDLPWDEAQVERWLRERFHNHGIDIEMRPNQENRPTANARPQFNATDIRLSSDVGLQIYGDFLEDVPALVPITMIYNIETNNWDLVLKAYHPVLMPISSSLS